MKLYDRHDFFDPILYTPVSLRDKMTGSHSTGDAAQHKLIALSDACSTPRCTRAARTTARSARAARRSGARLRASTRSCAR